MTKDNSPFTPGSPVPVELFVGRKKQIEDILRYIEHSKSGKLENVFLLGDRGIGKSSLVSFLKYIIKDDLLAVYVSLGGVEDLRELVRRIFEQVLKEANTESKLREKLLKIAKHVKEVSLFGVSISLTYRPPEEELESLLRDFPDAIKKLTERIKKEKKGIFIALDDINGLAGKSDFANWYKSFVDGIAVRYSSNLPVFIMLVGLPEVRDSLSKLQPSLMRIFRIINIEKLENDEVKEFFRRAFEKVNMEVKDKAMNLMVKFSGGLPILMQEIGEAVFWVDDDGVITYSDATSGILEAADRIGKKYLDPKVYRTIRSQRYRSILRKLGERPMNSFAKREIENKLSEDEKKVFNNFLTKMRKLGIIIPDMERGRGYYRFVNDLYPIYIWLESQKWSKR